VSKVLVVDDDPSVLSAFEQLLTGEGYRVETLARGEAALDSLQRERPDVVVMDIRMPGMTGLETFRRIKQLAPKLPVVIMTGYATATTAIEATKLGAVDYCLKPLDPAEILQCLTKALERGRLMTQPVELDSNEEWTANDVIIGQSRCMQEVYKAIGRVAATEASVLIQGETGTGKELVARALYQHSLRAQQPLIVVNCAAVPETLLESEFFGFEKGSFTGAERQRVGKFEQANGGTVFLDEIGDMSVALQAKLLRVLQERTFERIGGSAPIPVDVRVLAATHYDLAADRAKGRFREDLYHRLSVFTIRLPPLRERLEDLPRLVAYFAHRFAKEAGIEVPALSPEVMAVLGAHAWPGNVRELQHCIQRAMIVSGGYPIQPDDMRRAMDQTHSKAALPSAAGEAAALRTMAGAYVKAHAGENVYDGFMEMAESQLLAEVLQLAGGNQTHAAKLLGIPRPTLRARMDKHGLGSGKATG